MTKKFFQYYLPVALTIFRLVTIERAVTKDGGNDRLYGLPLPHITSSYGFTGHYDVFPFRLLLDLFFYLALTFGFFWGLEKVGIKLKTHWMFITLAMLLSLFWVAEFTLMVQESSFYITDKSICKTTGRTKFKPDRSRLTRSADLVMIRRKHEADVFINNVYDSRH